MGRILPSLAFPSCFGMGIRGYNAIGSVPFFLPLFHHYSAYFTKQTTCRSKEGEFDSLHDGGGEAWRNWDSNPL